MRGCCHLGGSPGRDFGQQQKQEEVKENKTRQKEEQGRRKRGVQGSGEFINIFKNIWCLFINYDFMDGLEG